MIRTADMPDELRTLFSAACDGTLSPSDAARLEELCQNEASLRALAGYLQLDAELSILMQGDTALDSSLLQIKSVSTGATGRQSFGLPIDATPSFGGSLAGAWHGTVAYFSEVGPFSYLVATVLVGVAILISSQIYLSNPVQVVGGGRASPPNRSPMPSPRGPEIAPGPEIVSIGRITGMVDCRWVNSADAPFHDRVVLGTKYMLASGLMEITYYTGAKVILQGPCTYEAESTVGGFLSLGKLTARVEKKSGRVGEWESGRLASSTSSVNHASSSSPPLPLSPSPPLFSVRTPTAVVTDLGTEFGVEVFKDRPAQVAVFRGSVKVAALSKDGVPQGEGVVMTQGQSLRVDAGAEKPLVFLPAGDTAIIVNDYVRHFPKKPIPVHVLNSSFEYLENHDAPLMFWTSRVIEGIGHAVQENKSIGGLGVTTDDIYALQLNCDDLSAVESSQTLADCFIPGQCYKLTAAVGARTDLRNAATASEFDWKISLNQSDTGKELASVGGTIANDAEHTGVLIDKSLEYTATQADAQHGIQIRLVGSTVGKKPYQLGGGTCGPISYDHVRLSVTTAAAPGKEKTEARGNRGD